TSLVRQTAEEVDVLLCHEECDVVDRILSRWCGVVIGDANRRRRWCAQRYASRCTQGDTKSLVSFDKGIIDDRNDNRCGGVKRCESRRAGSCRIVASLGRESISNAAAHESGGITRCVIHACGSRYVAATGDRDTKESRALVYHVT